MALAIFVLCLYLLLLLWASYISVRPPRTPIYLSPDVFLVPYRDVRLRTLDGVELFGWFVGSESAKSVAVMGHGYVMNRAEMTGLAADLARMGISSLVFDMRRHGKSGGSRCGAGWLERKDVSAAVEEARRRAPGARVFLLGSSMGAAASAFALAEDPGLADALVLDSSYSRLAEGLQGWWRFIGGLPLAVILAPVGLVGWALWGINPWRTDVARALSGLKEKPVLILHGRDDGLTPPSEAERNARAHGGAEIVWFEGCRHTEGRWLARERYLEALTGFLAKHGFVDEGACP